MTKYTDLCAACSVEDGAFVADVASGIKGRRERVALTVDEVADRLKFPHRHQGKPHKIELTEYQLGEGKSRKLCQFCQAEDLKPPKPAQGAQVSLF